MRVVREQEGRQIRLDGPLLARGGDASVYAVPDCPTLAARIFHNPTAEHAGKLAAMLAAPPVAPAGGGHPAFAWPVERLLEVETEGRVAGYLMPRFESAPLLWEVYNPGARLQIYPQFHFGSLLRVARHLAGAVHTLHQGGYVLGDLNESSVVVRPQALVTLIDVDSFQVSSGGKLYRCRAARPEYTAPELQGTPGADVERRPEHDTFALAVLIFQLLMQGAHPFAGSCAVSGALETIPARIAVGAWPYAWDNPGPCQPSTHAPPWWVLPPAVQELLRCCFEDARTDPALRPRAGRWQQALAEAENELTTCPRNGQHLFARGLDECPWCLLAQQQGRDPFPAWERPRTPAPAPRAAETPPEPDLLREEPQPQPKPAARPAPKRGWIEAGLQKVGGLMERQGWRRAERAAGRAESGCAESGRAKSRWAEGATGARAARPCRTGPPAGPGGAQAGQCCLQSRFPGVSGGGRRRRAWHGQQAGSEPLAG
jgi:DNA-binding helix-hairpin-helix protein with protein kinase domain